MNECMNTILHMYLPWVGLRTDERVLPINHVLTAVGHVRRGSDGRPAIYASPKFPYFLSLVTKAGMIQKLNQRWGALLGFPDTKAGMIQKLNQRWRTLLFPETKAGMIQKLNQRWGAVLGWGVLLSAAAVGVIGLAAWKYVFRCPCWGAGGRVGLQRMGVLVG
ncbi:unnamed protein product [Closterium sp. NIES-64]|nr:unnamed protein product [Closterium sp. NIES-64]